MTELRCIIVDDEAPARDELRHQLAEIDGLRVLGAAATAEEAEVLVESVDYDIVFLDIHMPGMGGLEFANQLRGMTGAPAVIFTTAYPDHAVDAFKVNAVDYLLKPFDIVRLRESIDRVLSLRHDQGDGGGASARPPASPRPAATAGGKPERIPVQRHDRTVFVDADDIFFATAARGYSYLKLEDDQVLVNFTLAELEDRLTPRFVRCHRSHLVNLDRIIELRPDFKGGLMLQLGDKQRSMLPVSRRQASGLRERLGL